jgi:hypothetical protein
MLMLAISNRYFLHFPLFRANIQAGEPPFAISEFCGTSDLNIYERIE